MVNTRMDVAERIMNKHFAQKQYALSPALPPASPTTSEMTSPPASPMHKVRFFTEIKVVLIPSKEEYRQAKIACDIWFQDDEYASYKSEAMNELRNFIQQQKHAGKPVTAREAMHMLYQPEKDKNKEIHSQPSSALSVQTPSF